jgi:hypothetical protein
MIPISALRTAESPVAAAVTRKWARLLLWKLRIGGCGEEILKSSGTEPLQDFGGTMEF